MTGIKIQIQGLVQGVGFRPFVCRLASQLSVKGKVSNDGQGVVIYAWSSADTLELFKSKISELAPDVSRIDSKKVESLSQTLPIPNNFQIVESDNTLQLCTQVPADAAICHKCVDDLDNPKSRFYKYPFISCSECGPRYSIIRSLPYDRGNTSMGDFSLCAQCRSDYTDSEDRRFHAQTIACPKCGPKLWVESMKTHTRYSGLGDAQTVLAMVAKRLKRGEIVAIKSMGGYRLVCDATNNAAIDRLRSAKHRPHKPFALMAKNIHEVRRFVHLSEQERAELTSASNPIVLLRVRQPCLLPGSLAPDQDTLGVMLPGTASELMLFDFMHVPLVMTSGNVSGAPLCSDNQQAREKLQNIVDCFLMNDRDIVHNVDDSVLAHSENRYVYRRARGLGSDFFELPFSVSHSISLLAMGGHKKSTFASLRGSRVYLSKHLGDLEDYECFSAYQNEIQDHLSLQGFTPTHIVSDLHEGYASSKYASQLAKLYSSKPQKIQHHHAHIAAVMLDHQLSSDQKVIGLCLDGLGQGESQQLWGAELLECTYRQYVRHPCLPMVPMPGGDRASKEPLRNLISHLSVAGVYPSLVRDFSDDPKFSYLCSDLAKNYLQMIEKKLNSPSASSMGRLFDAVAAALDICREGQSYEGQAGLTLESLARSSLNKTCDRYSFNNAEGRGLGLGVFWLELFADLAKDRTAKDISAKFHLSLLEYLNNKVSGQAQAANIDIVVLAGGVFQNRILGDRLSQSLSDLGLKVLMAKSIPTNDAALALGQAVVCAASLTA